MLTTDRDWTSSPMAGPGRSAGLARPGAALDPALVAVTALVGAVLGALTCYGQALLPHQLASLANSNGSWVLAAFILALLAPRPQLAAGCGTLALVALVAGYYAAADYRGVSTSTNIIVFWLLTAVFVGPFIGLSAYWIRAGRPLPAAIGTGLITGVLIGDGSYGLARIGDTTYHPYWWAQIGCGVVLLAILAARRLRSPEAIALAVAIAGTISIAFVFIFSIDWAAHLSQL